jgi:hypothetical protein
VVTLLIAASRFFRSSDMRTRAPASNDASAPSDRLALLDGETLPVGTYMDCLEGHATPARCSLCMASAGWNWIADRRGEPPGGIGAWRFCRLLGCQQGLQCRLVAGRLCAARDSGLRDPETIARASLAAGFVPPGPDRLSAAVAFPAQRL